MSKTTTKPNRTAAPNKKPTKAAIVIKLLKRKSGASLEELMKTTSWQPHSVRGFLSGTVKKRMGLNLTSKCGENGQRRYFVTDKPVNIPTCHTASKSTCEPAGKSSPKSAGRPSWISSNEAPVAGGLS